MKKSIVIGSDQDLRNWLFEDTKAALAAPDAALTVKDKESLLVYGFERRTNLPGNNRR